MHRGEFLMIIIKPFKKEHTKVSISTDGKDATQLILIENKNYRGTLQQEPASFMCEEKDWDFELGFTGDPYRERHYTLKVNNFFIDDLPEAPKREQPQIEIGRSEVKKNMTGSNP